MSHSQVLVVLTSTLSILCSIMGAVSVSQSVISSELKASAILFVAAFSFGIMSFLLKI